MLKKLLSISLLITLLSACASTPINRQGAIKPKPFITPYEYYSQLKPAVQTGPTDPIKPVEYQTLGEDTKEDHTQAIVVGSIIGALTIGGIVAGVLLLKK